MSKAQASIADQGAFAYLDSLTILKQKVRNEEDVQDWVLDPGF